MKSPQNPSNFRRIQWALALGALLFAGCAAKPPTSAVSAIVWNPWDNNPNAGEPISNPGNTGFYLKPYPGSSLSSVVMWLTDAVSGNYTFSLSATDTTLASSIGNASSGSVSIPSDSYYHPVTFSYSGTPAVTKGDQVSFTVTVQTAPSGGNPSFCTQASPGGNTNIVWTSNGNPESTGVAVVVNGGG